MRLRGPRRLAFTSLLVAVAQAGPAVAEPRTLIHFATGYARGIENNRDVHKVESRLGADYWLYPPLSLGVEGAWVRFVGSRDGQSVNCVGVTLLPLVAWHFWRSGAAALSVDLGWGGALFIPAFPPGGTLLNVYGAVGLQARLPLRSDLLLMLGVRVMHHSNGRDSVADNPAFDGVAINLGTGFRVGR
jgi:hypothetical protein